MLTFLTHLQIKFILVLTHNEIGDSDAMIFPSSAFSDFPETFNKFIDDYWEATLSPPVITITTKNPCTLFFLGETTYDVIPKGVEDLCTRLIYYYRTLPAGMTVGETQALFQKHFFKFQTKINVVLNGVSHRVSIPDTHVGMMTYLCQKIRAPLTQQPFSRKTFVCLEPESIESLYTRCQLHFAATEAFIQVKNLIEGFSPVLNSTLVDLTANMQEIFDKYNDITAEHASKEMQYILNNI